jgi:uncharacterized protein YjiS (DUF1127 family)
MFAPAATKPSVQILDSLGHFFSNLAAAYNGAVEAKRVYSRLSHLSNEQLAARGLTRDDIARLTLEALSAEAR